ncbi:hypothetical protein EDM59_15305 [Brevibacillus nitrificans]|uniref:Uncharacterized protein n=1 Tax=Brevibacillus nitrificans TaxID=651560 RepID=A0A3M8D9B9_9BACL|nr:hypothetical protein EDM59_15305 [Brevibacillus nitrificans]
MFDSARLHHKGIMETAEMPFFCCRKEDQPVTPKIKQPFLLCKGKVATPFTFRLNSHAIVSVSNKTWGKEMPE